MARKVSTTEKGDLFEDRCFNLIDQKIKSGEFPYNPDYTRIYRKKKYFHRKREAEVEFDITIEIWEPGADRFSFIVVIECKDHATNVKVDHITKFDGDIEHAFGRNAKAVLISSSPLASGARKYAENSGIKWIQLFSDGDHTTHFHRTDRKSNSKAKVLSQKINTFLDKTFECKPIIGLPKLPKAVLRKKAEE